MDSRRKGREFRDVTDFRQFDPDLSPWYGGNRGQEGGFREICPQVKKANSSQGASRLIRNHTKSQRARKVIPWPAGFFHGVLRLPIF